GPMATRRSGERTKRIAPADLSPAQGRLLQTCETPMTSEKPLDKKRPIQGGAKPRMRAASEASGGAAARLLQHRRAWRAGPHPPTQPSLRRLRKLACYGHLLPRENAREEGERWARQSLT